MTTDYRADSRFTVRDRAATDSADHPATLEQAQDDSVCGAQFGDVTNCICMRPRGHTGDHFARPGKSDNIASIFWNNEDVQP